MNGLAATTSRTSAPVAAVNASNVTRSGVHRPSLSMNTATTSVRSTVAAPVAARFSAQRSAVVTKAVAVEAPADVAAAIDDLSEREDIRNIAIIAHVDHGKTTLVDAMLAQSNIFRENQEQTNRVMDSNDLERERGITILSKNTAITYKGTKINVIDTPGHADFGGEVERVLNMCDGVLLLVDSVEGPMPQTKFVLGKSLELQKKVCVVVNKIDRPAARPDYVIDKTFDLFCDLEATDEQCDFPIMYASGANGIAGLEPDQLSENLEPLFDMVISEVPPPTVAKDAPSQMLCTNIDFDDHKGRIAIGRVNRGEIRVGQQVAVCTADDAEAPRKHKITELFVFKNFAKESVDSVQAGDICGVAGLGEIGIGETISDPEFIDALPAIKVEDPTVSMTFAVNTSPFAGREGKFVTARNVKQRLERELERNLALKVQPGNTAEEYIVSGRGTLHLGILIENMRREGYEFAIGPPMVITREIDGKKCEPFEEAHVEVPEEYSGSIVEILAQRKGSMLDMSPGMPGITNLKYRIPTRGLIGIKNTMLTATRGTAVINSNFLEFGEWCGDINIRENGSLISIEQGAATAYSYESIQARGTLFIEPGTEVYEGMVIGQNNRSEDLKVNITKKKALTNMRSANKEGTVTLNEPKLMGLDDALEYIIADELVEVTPTKVRIRKNPNMLKKGGGRR